MISGTAVYNKSIDIKVINSSFKESTKMKYSQMLGRTTKNASADNASINGQLLTRAGFISKQISGVYNYLPLGLKTLNKITQIVRQEMDRAGAQEVLMPAMTGLESWTITNRQNMDVLFHLEGRDDSHLVLNPTHEEVVTPLVQQTVLSYRDLPKAVFQIQNKFRNEPRAKSGLLRGREFLMKDLYSFHQDQADLDAYYEKMKQVYFKVYERLGLKDVTLLTFASGGAFSKYSHEFQLLSEVGEDTIFVCENCKIAINKEIIADQSICPECGNTNLVSKQAIEVGNIFKLGTRFSEAFNFHYTSENGEAKLIIMGCYGIGISRLMGTIVEIFHDDKGIIWPDQIAPFSVHLISLPGGEEKAEQLYRQLQDLQIEVLWDDRKESAGTKFADADLIGIPTRLVISARTGENVEYKRRNEETSEVISTEEAINRIKTHVSKL